MRNGLLLEAARLGIERLRADDPRLYHLLSQEQRRQSGVLAMVAASSIADPSVLICEGMAAANVTTEGYPGRRFHAGCTLVDEIERLAIERARRAFGASYANVQPHSGSSANAIVMFSLLEPGDTILGLDLDAGGHLTHGSKASFSGQYFEAVPYGIGPDGLLEYERVAELAERHRPKLIICGASAYPRAIDFERFREIADAVGAYLLADISHIAGLVAAGEHQSPIDHAHFTTTSTYKQLYGPRGGLILIGKDADAPAPSGKGSMADLVQSAVFPFFQGTPNLSAIAAKARALDRVETPEFKQVIRAVVSNAQALGRAFIEAGYDVLTGGTDNHMVLIDVIAQGITGVIAERALESCNIIINKNRIPGDQKSALVTSGIRLGTNSLAFRGMREEEMRECADLVHAVLSAVEVRGDRDFHLDPMVAAGVQTRVERLCTQFPIPGVPTDRSFEPDDAKLANTAG